MGTFISFVFVLIVALLVLAFAIALVARFWPITTEPVVLRGTDVASARELVATYVESVHDTRFGFPTGVFRVEEGRSTPNQLLAREFNFSGSLGLRIAKFGLVIPALFVEAAADGGCLMVALALMIGGALAALFVVPLLCLSVVEVILRFLLRSDITADVTPASDDRDAVAVRFKLRGLSAFGVRSALLSGLSKPKLPVAHGGSPLDHQATVWHRDRLNVVYAAGAGTAAIAAILIVALIPALHGGSSSSSSYGYDTASASSGDSSSSVTPVEESGGGSGSGTESDDEGTPQPVAPGLATQPYQGDGFTIVPPEGWKTDREESDQGSYIETRWHSPDDDQVTLLVDHTPGFAGTAKDGADSVHDLYENVSDYDEISYGPATLPAGDAWRWEFEREGLRKVDTFIVACGTGYAVLGAAPAAQWDEYEALFSDVTDTLSPECDEGSSSSSGPDSGSGRSSSGQTRRSGPTTVLQEHLEMLGSGQYDDAFALMSPDYQAQTPSWPSVRAQAEPQINIVDLGPSSFFGSEATVHVKFYARDRHDTKGSDTLCRRFVGTAHMRRVHGNWRYDPTGNAFDVLEVSSDNPACP